MIKRRSSASRRSKSPAVEAASTPIRATVTGRRRPCASRPGLPRAEDVACLLSARISCSSRAGSAAATGLTRRPRELVKDREHPLRLGPPTVSPRAAGKNLEKGARLLAVPAKQIPESGCGGSQTRAFRAPQFQVSRHAVSLHSYRSSREVMPGHAAPAVATGDVGSRHAGEQARPRVPPAQLVTADRSLWALDARIDRANLRRRGAQADALAR